MTFKKKLVMGAMSATLGLSLVAGGTWAAFNDIETQSASVAAGELNLELAKVDNKPYEFLVSNLKPGDYMERSLEFKNAGTLAIKDVLMSIELVDFQPYIPGEGEAGDGDTWATDSSIDKNSNSHALEYLDQFKVSIIKLGEPNASGTYPKDLILGDVTLKDFYLASNSVNSSKHGATNTQINAAKNKVWNNVKQGFINVGEERLTVSTMDANGYYGIPVKPTDADKLQIKIEFVNNTTDKYEDGTYKQNKFQGDAADIKVAFEARQWGGLNVQDSDLDSNGKVITNEKANSED